MDHQEVAFITAGIRAASRSSSGSCSICHHQTSLSRQIRSRIKTSAIQRNKSRWRMEKLSMASASGLSSDSGLLLSATILGHDVQLRAVESLIMSGPITQPLLFYGRKGIGKCMTAKWCCKLVASKNTDRKPLNKNAALEFLVDSDTNPDVTKDIRSKLEDIMAEAGNESEPRLWPSVVVDILYHEGSVLNDVVNILTDYQTAWKTYAESRMPSAAWTTAPLICIVTVQTQMCFPKEMANLFFKEEGATDIRFLQRSLQFDFCELDESAMQQILIALNREKILENPDVMFLANGSPGFAMEADDKLMQIPIQCWAFLYDCKDCVSKDAKFNANILRNIFDLCKFLASFDLTFNKWLLRALTTRYTYQNIVETESGNENKQFSQHLLALCQAGESIEFGVPSELVWNVLLMKLAGFLPVMPRPAESLRAKHFDY